VEVGQCVTGFEDEPESNGQALYSLEKEAFTDDGKVQGMKFEI